MRLKKNHWNSTLKRKLEKTNSKSKLKRTRDEDEESGTDKEECDIPKNSDISDKPTKSGSYDYLENSEKEKKLGKIKVKEEKKR